MPPLPTLVRVRVRNGGCAGERRGSATTLHLASRGGAEHGPRRSDPRRIYFLFRMLTFGMTIKPPTSPWDEQLLAIEMCSSDSPMR